MKSQFWMLSTFRVFREIATPLAREFSAVQKREADILFLDVFMKKSSKTRKKFSVFLLLVEFVALFRFGRPLKFLRPDQQERVLRFFMDSPVPLLRKGFWGASTLAKLSVYGQPSVYAQIGYERYDSSL